MSHEMLTPLNSIINLSLFLEVRLQKQFQEEKNKNDIAIQEINTQKKQKRAPSQIDTSNMNKYKVSHKL